MKIIRHPLFMRPHPDADLEQLIDRELRSLPERPAPETLMPRVMQAIAAKRALPWWKKSYVYWPVHARVLFLAASTGLMCLAGYGLWGVSLGLDLESLAAEIRPWFAWFIPLRSLVETLASAVVTLVKAAGPWFVWGLAGVGAVSYVTTVGLGTVCWRLVARRP